MVLLNFCLVRIMFSLTNSNYRAQLSCYMCRPINYMTYRTNLLAFGPNFINNFLMNRPTWPWFLGLSPFGFSDNDFDIWAIPMHYFELIVIVWREENNISILWLTKIFSLQIAAMWCPVVVHSNPCVWLDDPHLNVKWMTATLNSSTTHDVALAHHLSICTS